MKTFMLDLIEDLREKRLVPVAIALLVGIVAVPVVLAKGSDSGSGNKSAPAVAAKAPGDSTQIADLVRASGEKGGSNLGRYGSKDPFKPPHGYNKQPKLDKGAGSSGLAIVTPKGSNTSTGERTTPPAVFNGGGNNGGSNGSNPKPTAYTYVADITYSHNGKVRHRHGISRLAMLPSSSNPLLLFLGVTEGGGTAAFLVDSSLTAVGEGKCAPSHSQCASVYIGAGAEEEFTTSNGDSYTLRIDEIRKVKVGHASAAAKKSAKGARAHAAAGAAHRFTPPALVDLIEAASGNSKGGR